MTERLAAAEVDALTSGYFNRQDLAHEFAADFGRPYLNAATLSEMVNRVREEPRYRRIFQVCPGDSHYGPKFIAFMTELRDTRQWRFSSNDLAIVVSTRPMGDIGVAEMQISAARDGWNLSMIDLGSTQEDWNAAAAKVVQTSPAAVLIGDYLLAPTVTFLNAVLASPSPSLFYSLYAPSIPGFRDKVAHAGEGLMWATASGTYSDALAINFAKRYKAAYGDVPGRSHAGIAYDRVNILAAAWSRVINPRDFDAVADEIRAMVHRGVNGAYWMGNAGQATLSYPDETMDPSIAQAHLIYQIQDGRHRIIAPAPYGDSAFQPPPWVPLKAPEAGRNELIRLS